MEKLFSCPTLECEHVVVLEAPLKMCFWENTFLLSSVLVEFDQSKMFFCTTSFYLNVAYVQWYNI